ncbi:hypothetical protein SAMN02745866_03981 [Alteromonadaceae bacterium Bs31]|nr:hypothetical protein SAMN02745866_03981 [Alteromonadaceae bacterium Bs31]
MRHWMILIVVLHVVVPYCFANKTANPMEDLAVIKQAETSGQQQSTKLYSPKESCRIELTVGEIFTGMDEDIFMPAGTVVGITSAGGDEFSVLVGNSADFIVSGPLDYKTINCPKNFISAISRYSYEENSPYKQNIFALQNIQVFKDIEQTKALCTIDRGTNFDSVEYQSRLLEE